MNNEYNTLARYPDAFNTMITKENLSKSHFSLLQKVTLLYAPLHPVSKLCYGQTIKTKRQTEKEQNLMPLIQEFHCS